MKISNFLFYKIYDTHISSAIFLFSNSEHIFFQKTHRKGEIELEPVLFFVKWLNTLERYRLPHAVHVAWLGCGRHVWGGVEIDRGAAGRMLLGATRRGTAW